jgi:RNA polymerase sigma-70 factor (ECF subfamily)
LIYESNRVLPHPFKDKVFRLAKRLLIIKEEAEDATQEILNCGV